MTEVVLDASAVLANLQGERGGERVAHHLVGGYLSTVNLTEVVQRLVDGGKSDPAIREVLTELPCKLVGLDAAMAIRAGLLRRTTRAKGLSIGDRACIALAEQMGIPVLTADRAWAELDLGVEVVLIR